MIGFAKVLTMLLLVLAGATFSTFAQRDLPTTKSQEVSDSDNIPVLVKHLPDWEKVRSQATFINSPPALKTALGDRPILDLVDFTAGTEAVTAPYPAGKLLLIEYSGPQLSVEVDGNIRNYLATNNDGHTFYRRVGNYNILVFDATDEAAANALISQIKYEKTIQWLSGDPNLLHRMERAFVNQTSDLFYSTVEVILLGMGLSVVSGLIIGFVYFQLRERRRGTFKEFSDAGGMTRLNLDGFTPEIAANKMLSD
jgi:hypothetical protein